MQSKGLSRVFSNHGSKAPILQHSAFFIVQLSHLYMTTGKTIALTRQTFVDKVMSLLLSMLSRLVITFLPRSKCLLISWLQILIHVKVDNHQLLETLPVVIKKTIPESYENQSVARKVCLS